MFHKKIKITIMGRAGIRYMENNHIMEINSELLPSDGEFDISVLRNSIQKWPPPFEKEVLTTDQKKDIIRNLISFLEKHKFRVQLL